MPRYTLVGLDRYRDLFSNDVWWESVNNLAWFSVPFVVGATVFGLILAIMMDQRIRCEGALRATFLYPLALSQIVAGTAWQWLFNPTFGLEKVVQGFGWSSFKFNWLGNPDLAIFCVVIAAIWQCTGFVAALFLAGLRGVDDEIVKAAQIDGASLPTIYRRVILPVIRPVFFSVTLILTHLAIKTFDIIVVMTAGGPGTSTWLPSYFMYTFAFERGRMGIGAASAMMMLAMIVSVLVPLMYLESRATRNAT
jgi:glucose/mannose transport system permease protein